MTERQVQPWLAVAVGAAAAILGALGVVSALWWPCGSVTDNIDGVTAAPVWVLSPILLVSSICTLANGIAAFTSGVSGRSKVRSSAARRK